MPVKNEDREGKVKGKRGRGRGEEEEGSSARAAGCTKRVGCDGGRTARVAGGGGGEPFAGAGGRPSYAANPRQPHSITMLSRIQMTVISFGTPYT